MRCGFGPNAFLKELAAERNLPLADLSAAFWKELKTPTQPRPAGNFLTVDGVHMNPLGNALMAGGVLDALGLDDSQLAKARAAWESMPIVVKTSGTLTVADYRKLNAVAARQKKSVDTVGKEVFAESLKNRLADPAP